jgi:hypothetical protein
MRKETPTTIKTFPTRLATWTVVTMKRNQERSILEERKKSTPMASF